MLRAVAFCVRGYVKFKLSGTVYKPVNVEWYHTYTCAQKLKGSAQRSITCIKIKETSE